MCIFFIAYHGFKVCTYFYLQFLDSQHICIHIVCIFVKLFTQYFKCLPNLCYGSVCTFQLLVYNKASNAMSRVCFYSYISVFYKTSDWTSFFTWSLWGVDVHVKISLRHVTRGSREIPVIFKSLKILLI